MKMPSSAIFGLIASALLLIVVEVAMMLSIVAMTVSLSSIVFIATDRTIALLTGCGVFIAGLGGRNYVFRSLLLFLFKEKKAENE